MKTIFEQMGGTYRQEGDYLIPNLTLPDEPEYQIGKYGRMRRSYLKEHRPILYTNLLTSGTLHRHLAEIDQACNERMAIIVSDRVLLRTEHHGRKSERICGTVDFSLANAPGSPIRKPITRKMEVKS